MSEPLRPALRLSFRSVRRLAGVAPMFCLLNAAPALADSFADALARVYESNPTILAARRELSAVNENLPQARAGYFPQVEAEISVDSTATQNETPQTPGFPQVDDRWANVSSRRGTLQVVQPLYNGGRTPAQVAQAEALIRAQRGSMTLVEQQVLLNAALVYLDVARDLKVLNLNQNNVKVLGEQLQAARDRFEVGEVTRTDVAQAEARQAEARGDLSVSQANLRTSRASYMQFVGDPALEDMVLPDLTLPLPQTLEEALDYAAARNPNVVAATASKDAAEAGVDVAFADLLPQLNLIISGSITDEPSRQILSQRAASAELRLTIPLFTGGSDYSSVRQARKTAAQRLVEIDEARREAHQQTEAAWETLMATKDTIDSRQKQVEASRLALEGVREEAVVGSRTTLDVLDAEQELLDAEVSLISAQRDLLAAQLQLMTAVGDLGPASLELGVAAFDPAVDYNRVRNKLFGTQID